MARPKYNSLKATAKLKKRVSSVNSKRLSKPQLIPEFNGKRYGAPPEGWAAAVNGDVPITKIVECDWDVWSKVYHTNDFNGSLSVTTSSVIDDMVATVIRPTKRPAVKFTDYNLNAIVTQPIVALSLIRHTKQAPFKSSDGTPFYLADAFIGTVVTRYDCSRTSSRPPVLTRSVKARGWMSAVVRMDTLTIDRSGKLYTRPRNAEPDPKSSLLFSVNTVETDPRAVGLVRWDNSSLASRQRLEAALSYKPRFTDALIDVSRMLIVV